MAVKKNLYSHIAHFQYDSDWLFYVISDRFFRFLYFVISFLKLSEIKKALTHIKAFRISIRLH